MAVDMPCDQLEQTAVSVSRLYRHFGATDHLAGRVKHRSTRIKVRVAFHITPTIAQ